MSKQMTFRARQRKLKRKIRNDEWSRLMGNHRAVGIEEAWNLEVYAAKYIAPWRTQPAMSGRQRCF
jgi:hypothetical protein